MRSVVSALASAVVIPIRTRATSASRHRKMTARPSTNSPSRMYRSMRSGQSVSTTRTATSKRLHTMLIPSTASRAKRARMDQSLSSSAAATARFRTACRSCKAGTTRCGSIGPAPKSSAANGNFLSRSQPVEGFRDERLRHRCMNRADHSAGQLRRRILHRRLAARTYHEGPRSSAGGYVG